MGNYNPNLPVILGQEWVPIRDEDVTFSPNVNSVERGVGFALTSNKQASYGAYYAHALPAEDATAQATMLAIYESGRQTLSGPVEQVVIPCSSAATTGSGIQTFGFTATQCLAFPDDNPIVFEYNGGTPQSLAMFFAVPDYAQLLAGKRILNVSFIYSGAGRIQNGLGDEFINPTPTVSTTLLTRKNNSGTDIDYLRFFAANMGSLYQLNTLVSPAAGTAEYSFGAVNLGDVNVWYDNTISPTAGLVYPWRFEELLRFGSAPSDRQFLHLLVQVPDLDAGSSNTQVWLDYAALKVTYCNEERLAYGGRFGVTRYGINVTPLRNTALTANPILESGDYIVALSMPNPGDLSFGQGASAPSPDFNGLRQVYQLSPQEGSQVNIPFPLDDNLGETFSFEETQVLPQLSLHTSGGTILTDTHVYGRQAVAEVWGILYAQQDLLDSPIGASETFPWVRFYARRFGNTSVPLTLTGQGGLSGSSVSITPDEFDELEETLDGWKQVTLQFDTPPSMGTVGTPNWRFTATGELAGNRWEVLGASAPAISGIPGNLYNLAPAAWQLYTGTYKAPTGATQDLEWVPQGVGSPPISGVGVSDDSSDLFLIFAQEPPGVSGFGVSTLCQPLSGIGQECEVDPCCIPTSISFNQLTWDATLGSDTPGNPWWYELQRSDEVDTDWQTIMFTPLEDSGYMTLTGVAGTYASTPDAAALDITGDIDIRADVALDDWVTGGGIGQMFVAKYTTTGNQRSYRLEVFDGTLCLTWSTAGTGATVLFECSDTLPSSIEDGQRVAVRATLDVNNGAAGHTVTFYIADTMAGPWYVLGSPIVTAGTTSIFASTAVLEVGTANAGTSDVLAGKVYSVEVRNGIDGTLVANPRFDQQVTGTTSFVDSLGRTWTLQGDAEIVEGSPVSFNDFEARVGIPTSYRIRVVDDYGFYGPWSSEVTATLEEPGVAIGCDDGHLLIFTSNERQDGSINLAYSSVWMDQQVQEDFIFPEATFTVLQPMYNRDFFTAFRPTERGGEQFSRTVLVQAAAISPPTLGDFRSLRDMAWEAVNYICVRDEEGNRWFATIGVPSGRVVNNRRLYLAPVNVGEVTQTPTPVNLTEDSVAGTVTTEAC
jgi:hypothetical protein